MEDLPSIHRLESKRSQKYLNVAGLTLERLTNEYQTPGFDPQRSVRVIEDQEGQIKGLVEVWDESDPPVHPYIWMTVDPDYEGQGLEELLLEWAETRSKGALTRVDPKLRVAMRCHPLSQIRSTASALERAGFKVIRHGFRMRIDMDQMPPNPIWPEGISLRPYDPDKDARAVFETDEEVFRDHFGYVETDPEQEFARFMHHMAGDDSFDPSLWFLAMDGDEIAAICLCRRYGAEDPEAGYVSSLGVKRPWRRQGLAQALLIHAFGEFYRRGKRKVELGVDGESLTGATELYKKVGMYELRRYDTYEKLLRPGIDISVTQLGESPEAAG
jgi:ribosomal protein S18 acetylase RimI-like enzyme